GDMTGETTLDVLARLNDGAVDRSRQRELLDRMQLSERDLRRKVREYSTGMKRKLGIVQAFQSDPPLLVLDEPTEGLDPLMQDAFYELVAASRGRGRTVFMSSHVLPEVERVCDRIGLVRGGELVLVSTVREIRSLAGRRVRVSFAEAVTPPARWPEGWEAIQVNPRDWDLQVHGALGEVAAMLAFMSFSGVVALGYFHPIVLASLVGVAIATGTEPAAEVESRFADLTLARPMARHEVITRSVVLLVVTIAALLAVMTAATWI